MEPRMSRAGKVGQLLLLGGGWSLAIYLVIALTEHADNVGLVVALLLLAVGVTLLVTDPHARALGWRKWLSSYAATPRRTALCTALLTFGAIMFADAIYDDLEGTHPLGRLGGYLSALGVFAIVVSISLYAIAPPSKSPNRQG